MYKSTNTTWSSTFPLDKESKKRYTESTQMKLNLAVFDDDEVAGSAVDYLYAPGNQSKTQTFLKNNGFPSAQEREFGKELLGVQQERKNLMDEFKSKVKTPVNTEHYGESDRAFMQGLLGDEEGEREYQKRVANVNAQNAQNIRKQNELINAFKGSQFESLLKPTASYSAYEERVKNVQDSVRSAPAQGEYLSVLQPTLAYNASKQPENNKISSEIANSGNLYASIGNKTGKEIKLHGSAMTTEDWDVYNILQRKGQSGAASNFHFSIEEATGAYESANEDKGKKTLSRLKAVDARKTAYTKTGKTYIDNYDYTYGQGTMVYLGVHEVAAGQYHTSVIIMVSPESELYNNSIFENSVNGNKIKYATIGAGPIEDNLTAIFGGYLASDKDRDKDKILSIKEDLIDLNITNPQTILNLFRSAEYFKTNQAKYNLDYEFMPIATTDGYNSNSFTKGLLKANNIQIPREPHHSVPGWNKPVPSSYFGK